MSDMVNFTKTSYISELVDVTVAQWFCSDSMSLLLYSEFYWVQTIHIKVHYVVWGKTFVIKGGLFVQLLKKFVLLPHKYGKYQNSEFDLFLLKKQIVPL